MGIVFACICRYLWRHRKDIFLNNNKPHTHKGRICLIDGTDVYTPQRGQNVVSSDDARTLFDLYRNYCNVEDRCKVVTNAEIEVNGFSLSIGMYIEKHQRSIVSPDEARTSYIKALERVKEAETRMHKTLVEGGFVNE